MYGEYDSCVYRTEWINHKVLLVRVIYMCSCSDSLLTLQYPTNYCCDLGKGSEENWVFSFNREFVYYLSWSESRHCVDYRVWSYRYLCRGQRSTGRLAWCASSWAAERLAWWWEGVWLPWLQFQVGDQESGDMMRGAAGNYLKRSLRRTDITGHSCKLISNHKLQQSVYYSIFTNLPGSVGLPSGPGAPIVSFVAIHWQTQLAMSKSNA